MGLVIYSSIFYRVSDIFSYSFDRYCKIQLFRILSFGYQGSRSEFCRHEKLHQSFEIRYVPQILTNGQGNPDRTSMTLIMFLNSHLKSKNYGMAGALSVYLFIISGILCFFVYRMTNDNDPDGSKKAAKKRAKEERRRARS